MEGVIMFNVYLAKSTFVGNVIEYMKHHQNAIRI